MPLNEELIARYARQLLVPGFGEAGQERLLASRIRVVGADAVAGPALVYLVLAGAGRIWIDDPDVVSPADAGSWIYPPGAVGTPRVAAAQAALAPLSRYVSVEQYPTGGVPTAALICAPSLAQAVATAEASRRARIPHVVVESDADGGAVVCVPPGAACYSCARSTGSLGRPATPGAAALGALAALELVQLVVAPGSIPGRRIELVRGVPGSRATVRLPGCACGAPPAGGGGTAAQ